MATYQTTFLYELDENGNSATGKVDSQIPDGASSAVEAIDDGIIQVGETFDISFSDPTANANYAGTYTYIGHATPFSGFIAEANGQYYMFSNDEVPIGTNLNGFIAEDIPVCFAEGTRILTPLGEVPIETLRAGDLVVVPFAERRIQALRWVGHRRIEIGRMRDRHAVAPVLVRAGAFAQSVPYRDLRVSPEHAFFLEGHLVPARLLVDGVRVIHEIWCRAVTYWHLELDQHGILIADGAPAESYLDDGNRVFFENANLRELCPILDRVPGGRYGAQACAPLVSDPSDPVIMAIREAQQRDAFSSVCDSDRTAGGRARR